MAGDRSDTSDEGPFAVGSPDPSLYAENVPRVGARVLKGSLWQTGSYIAPFLFTLIVSIVAARVLGPDGMGRQSFISFIVFSMTMVCAAVFTAGLSRYVAELIGRGREGVLRALASWSWKMHAIAASVGAGLLSVVAVLGAEPKSAWLWGAVAVFAGVLHKVPGGMLSGAQRWRQNSMVIVISGTFATVATIVALLAGGGITSIFLVLALTNIVMLVWAAILSRRLLRGIQAEREPLGELRGEIIRFGLMASIPVVLDLVVWQRTEFFFLERYSSDAQLAYYSIAFSAYASMLAIPAALASTFMPAVATLVGAGALDRIRRGFGRGLRLFLIISLPLAATALVFGPPLLELVYGSEYRRAGDVLLILGTALVIVPLGGLPVGLLLGYGRVRAIVVIAGIAAVVDITLAALLIPRYDEIGAAFANVGSHVTYAVLVLTYAIRLVGGLDLAARNLMRIAVTVGLAAAAAQGVLVGVDGARGLVASLAVGAGSFTVLAFALRVLPYDDARWLVDAMGSFGRGRAGRICMRLASGSRHDSQEEAEVPGASNES